ncbi:hypothetical protein ACQEV4_01605 [Streptomyces shenzhenensis]|uniref:hypothetical protein n=1 Tax=Streptomyces shenzhenensis TaxID=943815 RepID=UPI003D947BC2
MTDWSRLSHAYGSAEDIPTLLDRIAWEPKPELWSDLWSALCHQGSVYSASFAALPWLADMAGSDDREQAVNDALALAGAIMAGAEQPHGTGDVRVEHAAEVESLLTAVNRQLRMASDRTDYIHLLEAMLGFEGVVGWSEDLAWGLGNEEYAVDCPGCRPACSSFLASEDSSPPARTTRSRTVMSRRGRCCRLTRQTWTASASASTTSHSPTVSTRSPTC